MSIILRLIKKSAVPMTPPGAYGAFHLTFFFAGLALCALLAHLLRASDERTNRRVMRFVGFFLLGAEIYKQLFQYYAVGYDEYPFGIFPFHLCSMPMYLCIVAGFLREGRLQNAIMNFLGTFTFIGGFISFFEPSGLNHDYWVSTLHSYIWHMVIIFLGFYLWSSGRVAARSRSFRDAFLLFLTLCGAALLINIIFYSASGGTINMFFLGPADATIVVFKGISERFGWYISSPLLIGSITLGAYIVYRFNERVHLRRPAPVPALGSE